MEPKYLSPEEAVAGIRSGDTVFVHTAVAAPQRLVRALSNRKNELRNVRVVHLHTEGEAGYAQPDAAEAFEVVSLFIGANVRKAIAEGRGSYIPVFLSEAPMLFRTDVIKVDTALISISPPDRHGYCSLGVSVDTTKAAIEKATRVVAQVNRNMPRTHGDGIIHVSAIHAFVEGHDALPEIPPGEITSAQQAIGEHVATLVEDGATLQLGIGAIPNAVLNCLGGHKNLGIHSEMFSDGVLPLVEKGVINNSQKDIYRGQMVATFAMGTRKLYDFLDDNPGVIMRDASFVNRTHIIQKNPRVTAINSAIEIDLTGQVCADSIGTRLYSGVGGQMDFIRGASLSHRGKPIIALPSTTNNGESRIAATLRNGAGVVTTRAHVHFVATEYGWANLFGMSLRERAKALISLAHPAHRESLEQSARELRLM
ncbi:MAG: 4-hydroxybutyrate CoA-transferase [Bacteroidetes bacterium]|nr:4-hydroxybutyrate CoA-transferase [Bacteroidota bacterium]